MSFNWAYPRILPVTVYGPKVGRGAVFDNNGYSSIFMILNLQHYDD